MKIKLKPRLKLNHNIITFGGLPHLEFVENYYILLLHFGSSRWFFAVHF